MTDAARKWRAGGVIRGAGLRLRTRPSPVLAGVAALALLLSLAVVGGVEVGRLARDLATPSAPTVKRAPVRVGEIPERSTATSTTRGNSDGSFTTTVYRTPVNFRAADRSWQRIDTKLHRADQDGFAWRSGANSFEARFTEALREGFAEFRVAGRPFRLTAVGTAPSSARVDGSTVSYPDAFPGANLTYTVTSTGVKEVVQLAGPDSPTSYTFRLAAVDTGPAPSIQRRADGSYSVFGENRRQPLFELPAPTVAEAGAASPARAAKPALAVRPEGRELLLTLSLDPHWLRAPGRRFPVQLDPTVNITGTMPEGSFKASGTDLPLDSLRLKIGGEAAANWRAALSFILVDVPADAQVTDAKLALYYDRVCVTATTACGTTSHLMDVHRITSKWDDSTKSSGLRFDATAAGSYTLGAGAAAGWMRWPITATVQSWLAGSTPNFGLLVKKRSEVLNSGGPSPWSSSSSQYGFMPQLEVTYHQDGGTLLEPQTLHANGAELEWTRYTGTTSGAPFTSYEVHRSATANFTPNASTLLTTIRDQSVTTYRDTTAKAGAAFTYRVRTNGSDSFPWTVTLPASQQARKKLRPGPLAGRSTSISYMYAWSNCSPNGESPSFAIGADDVITERVLQYFDLADIPAGATISTATASLWQDYASGLPLTIAAHRITRPWKEGTTSTECTGDGATWEETDGGSPWNTPGGDFDPTSVAQASLLAGETSVFRNFPITSLVQSWVNGTVPNNGLLFKATDETGVYGNIASFFTDDNTDAPALRPQLSITYTDGSTAQGPRVSLAAPGAGSTVRGSVRLAASAEDDRRVDTVEFLVDGSVVGTDTTAPFEVTWNSASVTNAARSVTVRATDDAGNVTTSAAVGLTVDNNALPTGSLSLPAAGATVGGDVTLTATASDDRGVASVAFLVDGVRVGSPVTASPYTMVWKTLDPLSRVFNGDHQLSAAVTDTSGQVFVTTSRTFTLKNLGTSSFASSFGLNDPATAADDVFPSTTSENTASGVAVQDPYAGTTRADGTSGGSLNRALADPPKDDGGAAPVPAAGATGSTPCAADETPDKVIDRRINTASSKWCSKATDKWVQVELPSAQRVSGVVVRHAQVIGEPADWNTRDFDILTSVDGTTWSKRLEIRGNTQAITTEYLIPQPARFVKLAIITPTQTTDPAARIYEIELYLGDRVWPSAATSSTECSSTETAAMAIDGNVGTKWCSLAASKTLQAQLPMQQTVSMVAVRHAEAGGGPASWNTRDYDIETSIDGVTWTSQLQIRGNTSSTTKHLLTNPVSTRYVRLVIITPTQDGDPAARIYELELYNAPKVSPGSAPPPLCPAGAYCPTVNVKNTSGLTWTNSVAQVWYRWYAPNGAVMFEGRSPFTFSTTVAANAEQGFPMIIYPPALPPGVEQGTYRLRIDVFEPSTGGWFSGKGNPPMDNPVIVAKSLATKLGLERYYQYDGDSVGAGMSTLANVANGNMLLRWTPFFSPGRGLATMTDLTYNSLEDQSKSPAGNNFSLSISGLVRFGEPLDIHPNKADEISGQANKWLEFTDGDGTTHRFTGSTGSDGVTRWQEPPGVNLYLRSLPDTDSRGRWALTRPDNVTFFFDTDGFPTMVEDRNTNRITFVLEDTPAGEDPGGPKKRVTAVRDAAGRSFGIDYWSKDEAKKAHVRGKIQTITDHSGSRLDFDYYDDGNLLSVTQRGGTKANGDFLADRSFVFTYTTSNGDGPAIPLAANRVNPEPKTPNQSTRLFSVRDPNGKETTYAYYQANEGAKLRWKLKERTNRLLQKTSYSYDLTGRVTTVTAPLGRATAYTYDVAGKVTRILNPKNEATQVAWSTDYKVAQVTEPTGTFTTYDHNPNGYPTRTTNQTRNETTELTYYDSPVDANDSGNHLSLLATVTRPKGVATTGDANDYRWQYRYDTAGNIDQVIDPTGAVTNYDYNLAGSPHPGTVAQVFDANGNPPTIVEDYHPSGQPTVIRDPEGHRTRIGYNGDGQVAWIQDPNHQNDSGADERAYKTFFDYDSFGRLGRQSAPKSTQAARGTLLWSGVDFDANDNVTREVDAHFGFGLGDPQNGAVTTTTYDEMDKPRLITRPDTSADLAGERTEMSYDGAGRLEKLTNPRGKQTATVTDDFTTAFAYDPLNRVIRQTVYGLNNTSAETRVTQMCYDLAGDLRSVTSPRAGITAITCPGDGPANAPYTTETDFDAAHRPITQRDELGHASRTFYDLNGNPDKQEQDIAAGRTTRTRLDYSQRDEVTQSSELFDTATGREVTTQIVYDANGNRSKVYSPRAIDAANGATPTQYVTSYNYDGVNRPTLVTLPFNGDDLTERQYVHNAYDPNGNLAWTSLPTTVSAAANVDSRAKTVMEYYDPGWIRSTDDPANPAARFDYTAQGWQAKREVDLTGTPGTADPQNRMFWTYNVDGMLKNRTDKGGQVSRYEYDANNNLLNAFENGSSDPAETEVQTQAKYTGFDEPAKVRYRKAGQTAWTFTDYAYDPNGNVTLRRENGKETGDDINNITTQTDAPRQFELTYDGADWLATQLDLGVDSACKGDSYTVSTWWATGWEKQRDIFRAGDGCTATYTNWPRKQSTTWSHFDNGKLRTLEARTGSAPGQLTESHNVSYFDSNDDYVNGNRTRDTYILERASASAATTCRGAAACQAEYDYDARDRLIRHQQRAGKVSTYRFDEQGFLLGDNTIRVGNMTTESSGGPITNRYYTGNQLTSLAVSGITKARYWYQPTGELDCVTTDSGNQASCNRSAGTNVIADYTYDYLQRLISASMYNGAGARTDQTKYTYDGLDRTSTETEDHQGTGKDRTTAFTYQGLSNLVTEEKQTGAATDLRTKTFAYDTYGHRVAMNDRPTGTSPGGPDDKPYSYGNDVHGSVSQLIDDAGNVKASYGYSAYGGADSADGESLTTGDIDNQAPLNPYRYTGRRMDSGSVPSGSPTAPAGAGSYDMGARRYGPDMGSFLQQDMYNGALANLGLGLDPLTQNRYALAGGNPISYVEIDGHVVTFDGGGGSAPTPTPSPVTTSPKTSNPSLSDKDATPTTKNALDTIVRQQTKGEVGDLNGLVGKACEHLNAVSCAGLRQGLKKFEKEFGGKPFDCNLFPDPKQCKSDLARWAGEAGKHISVSIGYCSGVCASVDFQGGTLEVVAGTGPLPGWGVGVTWNSLESSEKGSLQVGLCGAYGPGLCGGLTPKVDDRGEWRGAGWSVGPTYGIGELEPLLGYTVGSWKSGDVKGPQNPLPPSVTERICQLAYWC